MTKFEIEEKIVDMLKTVFDPEIPVNVYDLGLIYKIDVSEDGEVSIDMTLTAPNCPAADFIMEDVRQKVESIDGVNSATINLVFEPEWDKDMMSEKIGYANGGEVALAYDRHLNLSKITLPDGSSSCCESCGHGER